MCVFFFSTVLTSCKQKGKYEQSKVKTKKLKKDNQKKSKANKTEQKTSTLVNPLCCLCVYSVQTQSIE